MKQGDQVERAGLEFLCVLDSPLQDVQTSGSRRPNGTLVQLYTVNACGIGALPNHHPQITAIATADVKIARDRPTTRDPFELRTIQPMLRPASHRMDGLLHLVGIVVLGID